MIVYEVCVMDQDGAVDEPYYLRGSTIEEVQANVGNRHGDAAVMIRMLWEYSESCAG